MMSSHDVDTFQEFVARNAVKKGDKLLCVSPTSSVSPSVYTKGRVYTVVQRDDGELGLTDNLHTGNNTSTCMTTSSLFTLVEVDKKEIPVNAETKLEPVYSQSTGLCADELFGKKFKFNSIQEQIEFISQILPLFADNEVVRVELTHAIKAQYKYMQIEHNGQVRYTNSNSMYSSWGQALRLN